VDNFFQISLPTGRQTHKERNTKIPSVIAWAQISIAYRRKWTRL